ncbi:MAG TPA: hypothetical protein VMV79_07495 [Alphaproteobacteria bacterium]|nr:hypothetical protein [Alphaproteobacteria bacterium]
MKKIPRSSVYYPVDVFCLVFAISRSTFRREVRAGRIVTFKGCSYGDTYVTHEVAQRWMVYIAGVRSGMPKSLRYEPHYKKTSD